MLGFESFKDILTAVLIPATGGLVTLLWPVAQAFDKRRRFERLIARELEEVGPHPKYRPANSVHWTELQTKTFFHQRILAEATTNRDFILSLDPTLIYQVTQLWEARRSADGSQWLWYLECLGKRYGGRVANAHADWKVFFLQNDKEILISAPPH